MEEFDVRTITTTTICTFICEATIANVLLNFFFLFFFLIQFPFRLCLSMRRTNRLMHGLNRKNEFNYVVVAAAAVVEAIMCAHFFSFFAYNATLAGQIFVLPEPCTTAAAAVHLFVCQ